MNKQGKVWGYTIPIFKKNNVEMTRISVDKNTWCSKHKHDHKFNMFFVERGRLQIDIWKNDYDLIDTTILEPLQSCIVPPGENHLFKCLDEDTVAYEIYWVELDDRDIVRENVGGKE